MIEKSLNVVVTGATSGIGRAIATALAADGHRIFACARRQDRLDALESDVPLAFSQTCDVADGAQVKAFLAAVDERSPGLDVLFNGAGAFGEIGPIGALDPTSWWHTMQVNLLGTMLFCHHALPLLRRSESRRIVNFAGGGAFAPLPYYSAYAVSKSAVVRFTETLAEEVKGEGISANCMAPGFVITEIHDATLQAGPQRAGNAMYSHTRKKLEAGSVPMELVVEFARYLLTERASGLTGKTISVSFDPWDTTTFNSNIEALNASDLYTARRINLVNLEPSDLRRILEEASAETKASRSLLGRKN